MLTKARMRLAAWLDPTTRSAAGQPATTAAAKAPAAGSPVLTGGGVDQAQEAWSTVARQFALRVLATSYQASSHLESAEDSEQDPDRLERLYRVDHAITRIRRQAENLQVLTGSRIEDAGSQVTTVIDSVRAAASAIERYQNVRIGRIIDLAVVEYAADDVIRILTELLDNAARFSPASATVTVSAHLTGWGDVLIRVEDVGVGVEPNLLPIINAMFTDDASPNSGAPSAHLGLTVVQRLAQAHRLRIQLTPRQAGGTTATVLIPGELLCEIPPGEIADAPRQRPRLHSVPSPRTSPERLRDEDGKLDGLPPDSLPPGRPQSGAPPQNGDVGGDERDDLPRRTPGSTRVPHAPATPESPREPFEMPWPDEAGDFAAGIEDAQRVLRPIYIKGNV